MSKVWVLYVTFSRDVEWLRFSLESIVKYGSGFAGICVVVPTWDLDQFRQFTRYSKPECPVIIKDFMEYPKRGFVHHLAMKCYADVLCPDATHVLHMDPDCLFHEKVTPGDYFYGNRTVLVVEPYEVIKKYFPGRYHWKSVTEYALKFDCPYETMCCHPAIHLRSIYGAMRAYLEELHQTPFMDFVLKQKNNFPQGFGEFNTLGSFAVEKMGDFYKFHDCGPERLKRMSELLVKPELKIGHPHQKLTQLWSYTGAHEPKNRAVIQKILA